MQTKLHKNIMRRVYYSYTLSFVSQPMLWQGFVLGASIALFGRLTHVASIARNFSHTSVENAPAFIFNSFANALAGGEVLTVLVSVFMIGLSLSFAYKATGLLSGSRFRTA
jgi:predicted phage tail protein